MQPRERIICAVDVDDASRAIQLVEQLREHVGIFKAGLELVTAEGVRMLATLRQAGADRIFYDAKLHDIPNTVAGAMRGVTRLGAWCVTVHTTGGSAMLRAAVDSARTEAQRSGQARPKVLGVTVLTSIGQETLRGELKVGAPMTEFVTHLAKMAHDAGCDGVIASPHEIEAIRRAVPSPDFLIIAPGVRPAGVDSGDQARVTTPAEAIRRGADYLVIGRAITASPDPVAAAGQIEQEIARVDR